MHIQELVKRYAQKPPESVPDWMLGCFKRRSIAFANGRTDTQTHVFWLQSRNITIDLRLPIEVEQVPAKPVQEYSEEELRKLANYEGWYAESQWQNELLSWSGGTSLQIHNRWPEPAVLSRVGNCMMEFSPSAAYVEDWRIRTVSSGPLIGLRLIQEEESETGYIRHRQGALIINGDWAGLVLGRASTVTQEGGDVQLRDRVGDRWRDQAFLEQVFNFETSVARGSLQSGFTIAFSTCPNRQGRPLFSPEGFEFDSVHQEVIHRFVEMGVAIKRRYTIDTLEESFAFSATTAFSEGAARWFEFEYETLGRYLQVLE